MVRAPRAFLMARPKPNEWTITVHRDLEDLLAAWRLRSSPGETVAVLHLGFDRPHESEFEGIVARFPGKILLTAAAKSALPAGFAASREPVGDVSHLPIHLGTQGWGSRIDDDLAEVACQAESLSSHSLAGGVREFVDENPDSFEALSQARMYNEAGYLALLV